MLCYVRVHASVYVCVRACACVCGSFFRCVPLSVSLLAGIRNTSRGDSGSRADATDDGISLVRKLSRQMATAKLGRPETDVAERWKIIRVTAG